MKKLLTTLIVELKMIIKFKNKVIIFAIAAFVIIVIWYFVRYRSKLIGEDAMLNYFAELTGIFISVMLIPLIIKIYKKDRLKMEIAKKVLLNSITNSLSLLIPQAYKTNKNNIYFQRRRSGSSSLDYNLRFRIDVEVFSNIEKYFVLEMRDSSKSSISIATNAYQILKDLREKMERIILVYSDELDNSILEEFYKFDEQFSSIINNFSNYNDGALMIVGFNVMDLISILEKMRIQLISDCKPYIAPTGTSIYNVERE